MLFAGTVAENIARMAEAARRGGGGRGGPAGRRARDDPAPRPRATPPGWRDGGAPLSGGQRQRLGLARAVFGDARLIVLDEPNAHLDGSGEAALTATLARLKEAGATTVLITHRPQALQRADKVLVLEDGMVSRFGPRDAVLPACSARRAPPEPNPLEEQHR